MQIDQVLLVVALAAYITGALVLVTYFLARYELLRSVGGVLAIVGCAAQFAELGARWAISGIWPLTNLYGSLSLFSAMGVLIFLIFAYRFRLWFAGGFVLLIAAIALGYATTWNEGYMPPVPSLQSYWIKIHVPLVISAYASFMVAFVVAALYLVKYYAEERARGAAPLQPAAATAGASVRLGTSEYASLAVDEGEVRIGTLRGDTPALVSAAGGGNAVAQWLLTLPSLARLDVMIYRVVAVGLPLLTLGIITGAMWAKDAWGAYWQWDPKETAALVSWIVYASYMHLHTRSAWRGVRSAWISVLGFATIVFCYLGVNIWISGLHSYKM
ncbi:MAG: c-type cytochrome biogenesis protein CcsB [Candidatus Eremiobacteraeota bacterium]|nr:c-type cytochrome biogenesis protein CcsB [Candidatus Eremiobacteraeota bacterium]